MSRAKEIIGRSAVKDRQYIIDRSEPVTESGCWIWMAGRKSDGYGAVNFEGITTGAHRAAYTIFVGPIPRGMFVCHRCDVPPCVNPAHLFLGTNSDNMQDRDAKGRHRPVRGTTHPLAKLTEDRVRAIRERYAAGGVYMRELAAEFGVSKTRVKDAIRQITWAHVD